MSATTVTPERPRGIRPSRVLVYVVLVVCAIFYLMPVYVLLVTGLKSFTEVSLDRMWNLPASIGFDSFRDAWFGNETGSSLPDSDRATVDRAKAGDADAFGELVRTYQHRLVNFAGAIMSNRSDAEDVAQEAFLRAFRALGQFRGQSLFKTWLYQIATNVARTYLDKRRSRAEA